MRILFYYIYSNHISILTVDIVHFSYILCQPDTMIVSTFVILLFVHCRYYYVPFL
jgi:hypothetical protein